MDQTTILQQCKRFKKETNVGIFCETLGMMMTTLAEEGREESLPFSTHIIALENALSSHNLEVNI